MNNQALSQLKDLIILTEHFALRLQAYLWLLEFSKVELEIETCRALFCETSSKFRFGRQTYFSTFKSRIKTFLFDKVYKVGAGSVKPESSATPAGIGLGCHSVCYGLLYTSLFTLCVYTTAVFNY